MVKINSTNARSLHDHCDFYIFSSQTNSTKTRSLRDHIRSLFVLYSAIHEFTWLLHDPLKMCAALINSHNFASAKIYSISGRVWVVMESLRSRKWSGYGRVYSDSSRIEVINRPDQEFGHTWSWKFGQSGSSSWSDRQCEPSFTLLLRPDFVTTEARLFWTCSKLVMTITIPKTSWLPYHDLTTIYTIALQLSKFAFLFRECSAIVA